MKKIYILFLLIFSINFCFTENLNQSEIDNLYDEAKLYFRQALDISKKNPIKAKELYQKSVLRFEKIQKYGNINNGKLFYNIGNIYFRMKDIGRAILNYKRALRYIPNDPNLRLNLKYARSKRKDKIEISQKIKVLKTLFFWHYDFSYNSRIIIFIVSFILLWIILIFKLFYKNTVLNWSFSLSLILCSLFLISIIAEEIKIQSSKSGVILKDEVIARKGNSLSYEKSFSEPIHSGTEFKLLEKRGDWYFIELMDTRTCWIQINSAELL